MSNAPLTPTLSPGGRGRCPTLTLHLPSIPNTRGMGAIPLPPGERVGVRGVMRQNPIWTAELRLARQAMTDAEAALWQALRDRRFLGLKFRRMAPVGSAVAPFLCRERGVVINLAPDHRITANDLARRAIFAEAGLRCVILNETLIRSDLAGCLVELEREISR